MSCLSSTSWLWGRSLFICYLAHHVSVNLQHHVSVNLQHHVDVECDIPLGYLELEQWQHFVWFIFVLSSLFLYSSPGGLYSTVINAGHCVAIYSVVYNNLENNNSRCSVESESPVACHYFICA